VEFYAGQHLYPAGALGEFDQGFIAAKLALRGNAVRIRSVLKKITSQAFQCEGH
jgi:hypothetical protein